MTGPNQAQIELWKGRVGEKWAAMQPRLDGMLAYVTEELAYQAGPVEGLRVLDIGCGTGVTCAQWLDGGATVTGVDVSTPMLAVAADRTGGRAELIEADAAVWRAAEPYDLAVSQFGVMFFDDPGAAFANIAENVRPGGRLLFACWRSLAENSWATAPVGAISDLLPPPAPPQPGAPGPFALADRDRLEGILTGAGFSDVSIKPFDCPVLMALTGGVDEAVDMAMQIGPSGAALAEASDDVRAVARERLAAVFASHEREGRVTFGGAVWMVEAVRAG